MFKNVELIINRTFQNLFKSLLNDTITEINKTTTLGAFKSPNATMASQTTTVKSTSML